MPARTCRPPRRVLAAGSTARPVVAGGLLRADILTCVSGRDLIRMTDAEVDALLAEGTKAQVGTLNPDGSVHLVPMSYVVLDGTVNLWTDPASRKVSNLRRDPRITCLVEMGDDFASFRAVQLVGNARLSSGAEESRTVGEALFSRSVGPLSDDLRAYVAGLTPQRVAVSIEPTRIVSWDHRKLARARPDQVGA